MTAKTLADVAATLGIGAVKKPKAPSLFDQIKGATLGVVPGAVKLGGLIAKEATAPLRAGIDVARGEASPQEAIGAVLRGGVPGSSVAAGLLGQHNPAARLVGGVGTLLAPGNERYNPASVSQGESFRRTAGDIVHPSRFGQASAQGQIVGKLLEDVGNVSMVAGAGAPLLRGVAEGGGAGARLAGPLATGAERVESLGAKAANSVISPYRAVGRAGIDLAQRALEAAGPESKFASTARLLDPVLRAQRGLASEGAVRGRQAADRTVGETARLQEAAGTPQVFEAARARLIGLDEPIREAVSSGQPVTPPLLRSLFPDQVEGHAVTPEVGQMLADYHAGTLPPEVASKIDETTAAMRGIEDTRTQAALKGEGFSRRGGQLDPAQLGNAPVTNDITSAETARARADAKLGATVQTRERQLRRAQVSEVVPGDFTRRDVERTVLTEARQRRSGMIRPGQPAVNGASSAVLASDLGVKREATSLLRPATEIASKQGEALGVAKAADDTARRAARTTMLSRQQILGSEAEVLGRRATRAQLSAQATGDLPEAAVQAQAQQAGSSFAAGRRAEQATARRQTAEERLTQAQEVHRTTVAALDEKVAAARANPQNYPARWRPVMETQARWVDHLKTASKSAGTPQDAALLAQMAQDVPLLPDELAAKGLDPAHVTQGFASKLGREQTASRATANVAPEQKLAAEHERGANSLIPMSPDRVAAKEAGQAAERVHNEVIAALAEPMQLNSDGTIAMDPATNAPVAGYSRTAESVLTRPELDRIVAEAKTTAEAERPGDGAWARRRTGEQVYQAMLDKGWEAWQPSDPALLAHPSMVDPESTIFLKRGSAAGLREFLAPKDQGPVLQAAQAINRKWKGLVLPFSVRWQIGDGVGNMLEAWVAGDVPPWELASKYGEALEALKNGEIPDRLAIHGLATDDSVLLGLRDEAKPPRTPIGKGLRAVQSKAFGLNEWINNVQRSAYYLVKLEREGGVAAPGAVERAIKDNLRTMGDFSNLSPFERRYVTQALPFWSWIRHITKLTGRVALDNPARLVHMLRLSAIYADDQTALPDWAKGGLPVGGNVIPLGGLNPFADVFGGPAAPVSTSGGIGAANVLRALSPAIQVPAAALLGVNLKRENLGLTSPSSVQRKDANGKDVPTPLAGRPAALLSYLADQVPIAKSARALLPTSDRGSLSTGSVIHYDTGEPYRKGGKPIAPDSVVSPRADTAARLLVPFFPQVVNAKKARAIAVKRLKSG